jgi:hypothetical protein
MAIDSFETPGIYVCANFPVYFSKTITIEIA